MTENADFDPNESWPIGVWEKIDAGRVLISAGTYTENGKTYTYNLGDNGGEAKHQITIDEMPSHGHTAVCSSAGEHTHGISTGNNTDEPYKMVSTQAKSYNTTRYTESSGDHVHTISISSTGGDQLCENRMPYQVINIWKRIY